MAKFIMVIYHVTWYIIALILKGATAVMAVISSWNVVPEIPLRVLIANKKLEMGEDETYFSS